MRVIAVTGAGRAFSAGGDMKKYLELQRDPHRFGRFLDELHDLFSSLPRFRSRCWRWSTASPLPAGWS